MADAGVLDGINLRTAQGFCLIFSLQGSCPRDRANFAPVRGLEDLAVRVDLGVDAWKDLARRVGIPLSSTSALLSPTGSVLKHSQNDEEIVQETSRLVACLRQAAIEAGVDGFAAKDASLIRHDADGWVQSIAAEQNRPDPVQNRSVRERHQKQSGQIGSNSKAPVSVGDRVRSTKVRVKFSNGASSQIIEVADVQQTTLQDLLSRLEVSNIESICLEYPRRVFDLVRDANKTLGALELTANPSLIATTLDAPSTVRAMAPSNANGVGHSFNTILAWIGMLLAWLARMMRSLIPATPARPANARGNLRRAAAPTQDGPAAKERKVNQYWNGDSTVFEGPADDNKDGEKKDE